MAKLKKDKFTILVEQQLADNEGLSDFAVYEQAAQTRIARNLGLTQQNGSGAISRWRQWQVNFLNLPPRYRFLLSSVGVIVLLVGSVFLGVNFIQPRSLVDTTTSNLTQDIDLHINDLSADEFAEDDLFTELLAL